MLVQPRRRVSAKLRGQGEGEQQGRGCLSMLEMPFRSHQIMYRSSGPIPAAPCRHSKGLFEKFAGHFSVPRAFCLVERCGGRVDSENESRRPTPHH